MFTKAINPMLYGGIVLNRGQLPRRRLQYQLICSLEDIDAGIDNVNMGYIWHYQYLLN
ncbi:hypothetical protein IQ225_10015 [Synechocystis salina LEGE 06155]|nr:hypothetical protein [Synechocystis salina LEGE 06155]